MTNRFVEMAGRYRMNSSLWDNTMGKRQLVKVKITPQLVRSREEWRDLDGYGQMDGFACASDVFWQSRA